MIKYIFCLFVSTPRKADLKLTINTMLTLTVTSEPKRKRIFPRDNENFVSVQSPEKEQTVRIKNPSFCVHLNCLSYGKTHGPKNTRNLLTSIKTGDFYSLWPQVQPATSRKHLETDTNRTFYSLISKVLKIYKSHLHIQ